MQSLKISKKKIPSLILGLLALIPSLAVGRGNGEGYGGGDPKGSYAMVPPVAERGYSSEDLYNAYQKCLVGTADQPGVVRDFIRDLYGAVIPVDFRPMSIHQRQYTDCFTPNTQVNFKYRLRCSATGLDTFVLKECSKWSQSSLASDRRLFEKNCNNLRPAPFSCEEQIGSCGEKTELDHDVSISLYPLGTIPEADIVTRIPSLQTNFNYEVIYDHFGKEKETVKSFSEPNLSPEQEGSSLIEGTWYNRATKAKSTLRLPIDQLRSCLSSALQHSSQ